MSQNCRICDEIKNCTEIRSFLRQSKHGNFFTTWSI